MRLIRTLLTSATVMLALAGGTVPAAAQQGLDRPLRVYLDCAEFRCDRDFLTQEVGWVDFVRDRQVADVHVLGTRQQTGAGGSAYTLDFRGREVFDGQHLTLRAVTLPDATDSERRLELLRVIRLGLAPFAEATPRAPEVEVRQAVVDETEVARTTAADPWNRWVFRVGVDGDANGESQQNSIDTSTEISASRITPQWKLLMDLEGSVEREEYPDDDGGTYTSTQESYSGEAQAVKSVGPHWGVGAIGEWRRSTYNNYLHSAAIGPAVEYNVFPYSESTRRLLTFFYAIGPRYNVYQDSTIFDEKEELLLTQLLVASYDVTQPWGEIDVAATLDHYIAKFSDGTDWDDPQYNATFSGSIEVRLIQGLSARVRGRVTMVRGQIQLPAEGLTQEEILTRQRELATDYRYYIGFGLSYRFGSIFSDVVNPRFESF